MKKSSYDNNFKVKVAIEAIKGDKTYEEIASTFGIAKSLITKWRDELVKNGALAFNKESKSKDHEATTQKLYQQIGQLTMEVDFLKKFASKCNQL
jgi:transposase-like protein